MWRINWMNSEAIGEEERSLPILSRDWKEPKENCKTFKFRVLDGDGVVYYEGVSTAVYSFRPLDEFGRGMGCTAIQYKETGGSWSTL